MYPYPPSSSTHSDVTRSHTWLANSFAIAPSRAMSAPESRSRAALYTINRAASSSVAACATWNWMPWNSASAFPN